MVCFYLLGIQAAKTVKISKLSEFLRGFLEIITEDQFASLSLFVCYEVQSYGEFSLPEDVLLYPVWSISPVQRFQGCHNNLLLL
jgi:hypothetical protein